MGTCDLCDQPAVTTFAGSRVWHLCDGCRPEPTATRVRGGRGRKLALAPAQQELIRRLLADGWTLTATAAELGVSRGVVTRAAEGPETH